MEIAGICDEKFSKVRNILASSIESGDDVGVSFAVTIGGEMVVDLWGGHIDESASTPWQQDTLVNVYSTTKTMSFLCALVLADRGQLDFDRNVAAYLSGATVNLIVLFTKSISPVATLIKPLDTASKVYISNTAPFFFTTPCNVAVTISSPLWVHA